MRVVLLLSIFMLICDAQVSRTVFFPTSRISADENEIAGKRFRAFSSANALDTAVHVHFGSNALPTNAIFSVNARRLIPTSPGGGVAHVNISLVLVADPTALPISAGVTSELLATQKVTVLREVRLMTCILPSESLAFTHNCEANPAADCGTFNISAAILANSAAWPFGSAFVLKVSVSTVAVTPWKAIHDVLCVNDTSITISTSAAGVAFSPASASVLPLVLINPRDAFTDAQLRQYALAAVSTAVGHSWVPLPTSVGRRSSHPIGTFYTTFRTQQSVDELAFFGSGYACVIDGLGFASDAHLPPWSISCSIPLKGAASVRLMLLSVDDVNASNWLAGVQITLWDSAGIHAAKVVRCDAIPIVEVRGCYSYVECTTLQLEAPARFSHVEVTLRRGSFQPLLIGGENSICTSSFVFLADRYNFTATSPRSCVEQADPSQLCDGARDCDDGSDESVCEDWGQIATRLTINPSLCEAQRVTVSQNSVLSSCLLHAQRSPSVGAAQYLVLPSGAALCEVFSSSCAAGALATQASLVPETRAAVYSALFAPRVQFCTRELRCSGRGFASLISSAVAALVGSTGSICVCTCDRGYHGQDCNAQRDIHTVSAAVATISSLSDLNPKFMFDLHFFNRGEAFWIESVVRRVFGDGTVELTARIASDRALPLLVRSGRVWFNRFITPNVSAVTGTPPPLRVRPASCAAATCHFLFALNTSVIRTSTTAVLQTRFGGVTSATVNAFDRQGTPLVQGAVCTFDVRYPDYSEVFVRDMFPPSQSKAPQCSVASCSFAVPSNAALVSVTFAASPLLLSADCAATAPGSELLVYTQLVTPALQPPAEPLRVISGSKNVAFFGTIMCLGGGCILGVLAAFLKYKDTQLLNHVLQAAEPVIAAATLSTKYRSVTCMSKWCYRTLVSCGRHDGKPWYRQYTTLEHVLATICFILLTAGGMFALFYNYDLFEDQTNFSVLIEEFNDDQCELSAFSPVARRVMLVPATGRCEEAQIAGDSASGVPRLLRASCSRSGTSYVATVAAGNTGPLCSNARAETFNMRDCSVRGSTHVHVTCVTTDVATAYFAAHEVPTMRNGFSVDATPVRVPLAADVAARGADPEAVPMLSSAIEKLTPSPINSRVEMVPSGTRALLRGDGRRSPQSLYFQRWLRFDAASTEWYSGWASSISPDRLVSTALLSESVVGAPQDLSQSHAVFQTASFRSKVPGDGMLGTRFFPNTADDDLTVGVALNGYGTASERRGSDATEMLMYPDRLSSAFNLGLRPEGTIMFWLHASANTRGFAVAIADDWRVRNEAGSPLLHRLHMLVERHAGTANVWFETDWHVYFAVYIDATTSTIRVVSADPTTELVEPTVFEVLWQLEEIDATRVFAGSWHHIAIAMSRGQEDATSISMTLYVDGQSITSEEGWRRCLPRAITPIRPMDFAVLERPAVDVVGRNGTVIVGALNAAVYGVEAFSYAVGEDEILSRGTLMMSNFFSFNKANFTMIGFYVLFTAVALLLIMITGVIQDSWGGFVKDREDARSNAQRTYFRILNIDDTSTTTQLSTGKQFNVPSLQTAIDLVGLSDDLFSTVLEEIEKLAISDDGAVCDLLALLWSRGLRKYSPPATFKQMFDEWKDKETSELSVEGHFVLPVELWNNFLSSFDGGLQQKRRGAFADGEASGPARNDAVGSTGTRAVRQVRVTRIKFGGRGGGAKGTGGGKGVGGRSGQSNNNANQSGADDAGGAVSFSAIIEMLLPVMTALQAAALYVRSFEFPDVYFLTFLNVFKYISLDFFDIPGLPALISPLVTFGIGCVVVLLLLYFTVDGHMDWLRYVAAYVQRRDAVDAPRVYAEVKRTTARKAKRFDLAADGDADHAADADAPIVEEPPSVIEDWMVPMFRYVLPQKVTNAIDQYFDKSRKSNIVRVKKNDLLPAPVASKGVDWEIKGTASKVLVGVANDRSGQTVTLEQVGIRCPLHGAVLCEMEQSAVCIKPFECFVIQSGERCSNRVGRVYACQRKNYDGSPCTYALCQDHFKVTLSQYLLVTIISAIQTVRNLGISGVLAFTVIALSVVVYFPVMRICLQFLYCDPAYQCVFDKCWNDPDRKFILAVCVVSLVATYVGILLPVALYRELRARKRVLTRIFHRREYQKIYLKLDEAAEEELERFNEQEDGVRSDWFHRIVGWMSGEKAGQLSASAQLDEAGANTRLDTVDLDEWERFLSEDGSPMHHIYKFLEFEWITLPPLMLFYRLGILVPTIFIENSSVLQLSCVCGVEVVFGIFIFWSQPYINSWVDTMYRAGSVHNISLLGLSAFHRVLLANGDSDGLQTTMLLTTTVYLGFVVLLLCATTIWPLISYGIKQLRVEWQLAKVGLRTNDLASLFLNPLIHDKATVDAEEVYSEMRKSHENPHHSHHHHAALHDGVADEGLADTPSERDKARRMSQLKRKSLSAMREQKMQSFVKSRPNAIQLASPTK